MSEKYRPANGSEGLYFTAQFCEVCVKDANFSCDIYTKTMIYGVDEKEYPAEWTYDEAGNPVCTAFKKAG